MEERGIKISAGDLQVTTVPNLSRTDDLVWAALPVEASVDTWGDGVYFRTPVVAQLEGRQGHR